MSVIAAQELNDEFLNNTCYSLKNFLLPCTVSFRESTKVCLSQESLKFYEPQKKAAIVLINYLCSKKTEDYNSLKTLLTDQCLMTKLNKPIRCSIDGVEFYQNQNPTQKDVLEMLTDEKCMDLVNLDYCFTKEFNECNNKQPVEFISGFLKAMIKASPCQGKHASMTTILKCRKIWTILFYFYSNYK